MAPSSAAAAGFTRRCRARPTDPRSASPSATGEASNTPRRLFSLSASWSTSPSRTLVSFCTPTKYATPPSCDSTGDMNSSLRNSVPSFLKFRSTVRTKFSSRRAWRISARGCWTPCSTRSPWRNCRKRQLRPRISSGS